MITGRRGLVWTIRERGVLKPPLPNNAESGRCSFWLQGPGNPGLLMTSSSTTNRKLRGFMISSDFFIIVTTEVNFFFFYFIYYSVLSYLLCFYESSTFMVWKIRAKSSWSLCEIVAWDDCERMRKIWFKKREINFLREFHVLCLKDLGFSVF